MNTPELQRLKIAWLAAKEAGDTQMQIRLLRDHPREQEALVDFIAAYHAIDRADEESLHIALDNNTAALTSPNQAHQKTTKPDTPLLALTQRACQHALERVFEPQPAIATLGELRKSRHLSKVEIAKGLRLGIDVWNKFEEGAIELVSLSQRQLQRLAEFFQVSAEQFSTLLNHSQPAFTLNRRQTSEATHQEQGPRKQSFTDAINRSTMPKEDKQFWMEA